MSRAHFTWYFLKDLKRKFAKVNWICEIELRQERRNEFFSNKYDKECTAVEISGSGQLGHIRRTFSAQDLDFCRFWIVTHESCGILVSSRSHLPLYV